MSNNNENHVMSDQGELLGQFSSPSFLVNAVGPDLTILGQHNVIQSKANYQGQHLDTHPALFDQNQVKDGFGPVYAVPSFPLQHGHGQGTGNGQWQQWGSHHQMIPYYMYSLYYMYPSFRR